LITHGLHSESYAFALPARQFDSLVRECATRSPQHRQNLPRVSLFQPVNQEEIFSLA
jgi:hypothetical protein